MEKNKVQSWKKNLEDAAKDETRDDIPLLVRQRPQTKPDQQWTGLDQTIPMSWNGLVKV